ncbi:MFS transporter [Lachnoclostridium sp. Marseille-P6806]|uniref:MFS transporter n=1 Tax=Lachnoclostridium sp. Marseille-P6806 TaxID=2364793 RepID=UPI001031B1A4|nr:glycoside-pentoside-hexuronide (GPH):cation symporter [Lachnoclostridium sp. Marseille-P6806]
MAGKPLGTDKFGVQKVMRKRDYLADSLGQFALNSMSGLVGQLTYFYTDKVGMAAGAVATVFFLCKIIDAFTDIIMGHIVDHTAPGREKYRPWLLRMSVPAAVILVMLFTVPSGFSAPAKIAYMFITNILLTAVVYTAICIPYASLMVVRTNSQEERGNMGIWRAAAGYVSGMIIAIAIIPVTNALGGNQSAWIKFGVGFALLVLLTLLICYLRAKEQAVETGSDAAPETEEEEESVPFGQAIANLFRNKYWVMILVMGVLSNVSYGISGSSGTFYCKLIYGDDNLVGILGAVGLIPTLLGFIAVGPMVKKLGVTKTLKISFFIGTAATAVRIINPTHFWYNTVMGCFASFANIPMMCLLGVMAAMAIDYNEYKYDRRMVGTSQAASGFGGKIGSGIGASLVGWCLGFADYDGLSEIVTPAVRQAVYTFGIYIPLVLFVIMLALTLRFDLEAKLPAMREEIAVRKQQRRPENGTV